MQGTVFKIFLLYCFIFNFLIGKVGTFYDLFDVFFAAGNRLVVFCDRFQSDFSQLTLVVHLFASGFAVVVVETTRALS